MWQRGKELLEPPYGKTPLNIYSAVVSGQLVPYENYLSMYPDPNEPQHMRRYFYFMEPRKTRDRLAGLRNQRGLLQNALPKTDDEIRREDAEEVEWCRRTGASSLVFRSIEERRGRWRDDLTGIAPEIERLEAELDPTKAWLSCATLSARMQDEVTAALLECFYCKENIDEWANPQDKPKGKGQKDGSDKERAIIFARGLAEGNKQIGLDDLAEKTKEGLNLHQDISTVRDYVRPAWPGYTALKPGAKKKIRS
jgi:hypothetical protein